MARTKKQTESHEIPAVSQPGDAPEVIPAKKEAAPVAAQPVRIRALAHIHRVGGNVRPGEVFSPTNETERRWLLSNHCAEPITA